MYLLIHHDFDFGFEEYDCKEDAIGAILDYIKAGANTENIDIYKKVTFTSEVKVISADITD